MSQDKEIIDLSAESESDEEELVPSAAMLYDNSDDESKMVDVPNVEIGASDPVFTKSESTLVSSAPAKSADVFWIGDEMSLQNKQLFEKYPPQKEGKFSCQSTLD